MSAVSALLLLLPISLSVLLYDHYGLLLANTWTFGAFYATLVTSILTYRLSPLHPLAQYPGPPICKVTALWMAYITSTGKRHIYLQRLHEQYGDAIRTGELSNS